jgi:hypothetical protein
VTPLLYACDPLPGTTLFCSGSIPLDQSERCKNDRSTKRSEQDREKQDYRHARA